MSLDKVVYVDGTTVINAKNLNDIQDAIIDNTGDISDLESDVSGLDSGKVDKVNGKGLSENDFTDALKAALEAVAPADATLSTSGKAADAKAAGDAIAALSAYLPPDTTLAVSGKAADAKETGDKIADAKNYSVALRTGTATTIPDNTDYDTLTTPGNYRVTTAASTQTMTNCPITTGHRLFVMTVYNTSTVVQIIVGRTGRIYTRAYVSASWSDWQKLFVKDDLDTTLAVEGAPADAKATGDAISALGAYLPPDTTLAASGKAADAKATGDMFAGYPTLKVANATAITNGTDYDTLTTPGCYRVANTSSAQTMVNCPTTAAHRLFVYEIVSNRIVQIVDVNYTSVREYRRYYNGSTWTDWKEAAYVEDVPVVDSSLADSGKAADAKATGDAINSANAEIASLDERLDEVEPPVEWHVKQLPIGYKRVEYAESTGSDIVNLGFQAHEYTRTVCRFQLTADLPLTANGSIFGGRTSTSSNAYGFAYSMARDFYINYYNTYYNLGVPVDHSIHTVDINGNNFYFDGELKQTALENEFTSGNNVRLFGIRGAGTNYYGEVRIYECWVYNTTDMIHHYVPCIRVSDDTVGMYDLVADAFIAPDSGTLLAGDVLSISDAYADIENLSTIVDNNARANVTKEELRENTYGIPDYVQQEADRVAEKVRNVQTGTTLTFAAVSDMHFKADETEAGSGAVISKALLDMSNGVRYVTDQIHVDFYASFGDIVWRLSDDGDYDKGHAEAIGATKILNDLFGNNLQIRMVGNHDPNCEGPSGYFTPNVMNSYAGIYNNFLVNDSDYPAGGYGYYDFEDRKIRLIVLNTSFYSDTAPSQGSTYYTLGTDQLKWLARHLDISAKADAEDWQIVIMSHVNADTNKSLSVRNVTKLLKAYVDGGNWPPTGTAYYDFYGKNAAKIAVYFNGHAHRYNAVNIGHDYNTTSKTYESYLPITRLCVPNAVPYREEESMDGVYYTKTAGTGESTAFQIITLDWENKVVYAHHYGAGIDIILHYESLDVSGTETLSTGLTSPSWASVNDTAAEVSNGVVTVRTADTNVVIYAKSTADNAIEAWNIHTVS